MERNVDLLKSQFDIDREPFSDAGISGLFYPGAGRQQALEQLLHLVRYGPPLLFVMGAEGSGKTLLSRQLIRQIDSGIFSCVSIEATVLMDDRALMALICDGFNLHVELTKDSVISALVRFAAESESYSQTALVVVDDVQNLSEAAADFLAEIAKLVKDSGLRFLLLVEAVDLKKEGVLAPLEGVVDSLGQCLELPVLDVSEVADYVSYRMRTAGLDGVRFSPQQVKQIAGESGGIISRVNQFARETLVHQVPVIAKEKRQQVMSRWHLMVVAVVSVGIGLLMVGRQVQEPRVAEVAEILNNSAVVEGIGIDEVPLGRSGALIDGDKLDDVETPFSDEGSLVKPYVERAEVTADSAEKSDSVDLNYEESVASPQTKGEFVAKTSQKFVGGKPLVEKTEKGMLWDDSIQAESKKAASAKTSVNEVALVSTETKDALLDKVELEAAKVVPVKSALIKPKVSKLSTVLPPDSTKSSTKPIKKPRLNNYTIREKWLLSLDPKQFTLQMIGARDEAAVQEFISRYPSLRKVAYYKTRYKGGDWYVVIYGQFATKSDAKQAVTRLPKNLIASKPWTRPLASVQKDIRMARL